MYAGVRVYIYIYIYIYIIEKQSNPEVMSCYEGKSTLKPFGFNKLSSGLLDDKVSVTYYILKS